MGTGFLSRLLRNRAGNTLVITGAALLPMSALAGSAVDMSRLYLVKARLQQACDAGALAGRRAMTSTTFTQAARDQATNFFRINFETGAYGTTASSFNPSKTAAHQVQATATATVPMVVMYMFGKTPETLTVECEARFEVANTDVVFVLDTTGSMACGEAENNADCTAYASQSANTILLNGRWQTRQRANSRLMALRTAIKGFHETLSTAISTDARLRFAFVPYSSSVHIGERIREMSPAHLVDSYDYQSRRRVQDGTFRTSLNFEWRAVSRSNWSAWAEDTARRRTGRTSAQCDALLPESSEEYGDPSEIGARQVSYDGDTEITVVPVQRSVTETAYRRTWGTSGQSGSTRTCIIDRRTRTGTDRGTATATRTPNYTWSYDTLSFDTSRFKNFEPVTTRTGNVADATVAEGTQVSSTWSGCVNERRTVAGVSVQVGDANADDLNFDLVPNTDETRWRPSWPEITYLRSSTPQVTASNLTRPTTENTMFSCPKAVQRLQAMTGTQVNAYVDANDFVPHGGTYHDIGLIWAGRLLSATGIFADDNGAAPNGGATQQHIIFMTDGDMSPSLTSYGTYGPEYLEGRIGGNTTAELKTRHNNRFSSICREIRRREITLWVVAYGQEMTTELRECATPGLAFAATNGPQLQQQFRQIAAQIAELRLER